jgi:hypothetical protein
MAAAIVRVMSIFVAMAGAASIASAQAAPDVISHTVNGPLAAAPLLEIGADFGVKIGGKQPLVIPGAELIALRRAGAAQPASCPPPFIELTTGDRVPLADPLRLRLEDETLEAALAAPLATAKFAVPQAAVALIAVTSPSDVKGKRTNDLVVLRNGDTLGGKLLGIDVEKGARLILPDQTLTIPLERIAQIAFNPDFQARPRVKNIYADVVLANGARLALAKLTTTGAGGELAAHSHFGHHFTLAAADVLALRMRQGKAVYLDELKPKAYESTPFLDVAWPLAIGRSLLDGPLKIGADSFPLGLGMHSRSQVTYAIDPADAWFEAVVAVDAAAGPRGAVKIDVALDGKSAAGVLRTLKAGAAPAQLRINVQGAKTMTLVTDFGPRGDVQGHALWVDARLIRK